MATNTGGFIKNCGMINNLTLTIPSLSGTFGIHTRLTLNPKMPKEPSSPSRSNARIEQQCIDKHINDKLDQGQRTTDYIGVYQKYLSESRGGDCIMHPSCSNYGLKAVKEFNPYKAFLYDLR